MGMIASRAWSEKRDVSAVCGGRWTMGVSFEDVLLHCVEPHDLGQMRQSRLRGPAPLGHGIQEARKVVMYLCDVIDSLNRLDLRRAEGRVACQQSHDILMQPQFAMAVAQTCGNARQEIAERWAVKLIRGFPGRTHRRPTMDSMAAFRSAG